MKWYGGLTGPPPITREGAREAARHELSKPAYAHGGRPLIVSVLESVGRFLRHTFDVAAGAAPGGAAGLLVMFACLVAIVVAVRFRHGPLRPAASRAALFEASRVLSAAEHRASSERLAADGELALAIRERLRAITRELEERAIIDPRPGQTADGMATLAGSALPGLRDPLVAAAATFDEIWYGGRPATRDHYDHLVAVDGAVRREHRRRAAMARS
jgi:hypothetical protein